MMKLNKQVVLEILSDLEENVQNLRENGDTDMRSVLSYVYQAQSKIRRLEE